MNVPNESPKAKKMKQREKINEKKKKKTISFLSIPLFTIFGRRERGGRRRNKTEKRF